MRKASDTRTWTISSHQPLSQPFHLSRPANQRSVRHAMRCLLALPLAAGSFCAWTSDDSWLLLEAFPSSFGSLSTPELCREDSMMSCGIECANVSGVHPRMARWMATLGRGLPSRSSCAIPATSTISFVQSFRERTVLSDKVGCEMEVVESRRLVVDSCRLVG